MVYELARELEGSMADKAALFEVLSERGLALQNVHYPESKDRHLVMAAVQQAGMALEFADAVREHNT